MAFGFPCWLKLTQGEVCVFGCLCCAVPLSRFRRLSGVGVALTALALNWLSRMVSDGFQTQKRGSWILGKERAERVLASAISIDGRKKWICSATSQMCGGGGVAGAATMTSQQGCV